jgi:hypothetical protein
VAVAVATGCGQAGGSGGSRSGSSSTVTHPSNAPTTTAPRRTAADDLARFFAQAAGIDQKLHAAALLINGGIGMTSVQFNQATVDAVAAADPAPSAAAIPAGMTPDLLRAVILVQSDLASRWYAFDPVLRGPEGPPAQERTRVLTCLANGARAAGRFDADLAAARALAAVSAPVRIARPASHAAAEVAIRLAFVDEANAGCDSCGGSVAAEPPAIVWRQIANPYSGHWDGTAGRIPFRASYRPGRGWKVELNAC